TLEIAQNYPVRVVHYKEVYVPGNVINSIIDQCESDIIVFINSDTVCLSPYSLKYLIAPLADAGVAATYGRQVTRPDAEPWVIRDYEKSFPESSIKPPWMFFSFPIASLKKSVWIQHKIYTDAWGSEDTEWGHWVVENTDKKITYVPKAVAMHSHNYTLKQLHNRKFIEGEADFFIFKEKISYMCHFEKFIRRCFSEFVFYFRNRYFFGIAFIPIRNLFYFVGYIRGMKNGIKREHQGDSQLGFKNYQ
ncbi:MAG: glycosyltransferase, partial [Bdellovibrionales bacterium]|nr:glycosyltransferase [Bdellovibrionales bacterium]